MTERQLEIWAARKIWSAPAVWSPGVELARHPPPYAECRGEDDPFCGRCRFSVHGCAGAPSRAEYLRVFYG